MKIIRLCVGMVQANCLICYDENTLEGFVVDPGGEEDKILAVIAEHKLKITHILCTHGHFDHIMAAACVREATGAKVCVHTYDAPKLGSAQESLYAHFSGTEQGFVPVQADVLLQDGDEFTAAGVLWEVIHTPGHTAGCVCFDSGEILISGDTVFADSCGRVDFPDGDRDEMMRSLLLIAELDGERMVYSGHGMEAQLSYIRRYNPFVRQAVALG